jgi:dUTPase
MNQGDPMHVTETDEFEWPKSFVGIIQVKKLCNEAMAPKRLTPTSPYYILYSAVESVVIAPDESAFVSTGIALYLPHNYHMRISREFQIPHAWVCTHTIPTENNVTDEVCILLYNQSPTQSVHIKRGQRIATFSLESPPIFDMKVVKEFHPVL